MTDRLSGSTPNLADVIEIALEAHMLGVHTALPGVIKEWDPDTQHASVLPSVQASVRDLKGRHVFETLPLIYDVPVMFPRTLAGYITFPIQVGDTGLLIFPELDPAQWRYSDPSAAPKSAGDQSRHAISGAVFIPGLYQRANRIADYDPENVVVSSQTVVKIGAADASSFVALADKVLTELGNIRTAFNAHTHGGVTTGGGASTGPVSPMAAPSSVAATKVKAK